MKALLQRVRQASVEIEGQITGEIGGGLLVFLGVGEGDGERDVRKLAEKTVDLRVFPDDKHSMNRSLRDTEGEILLISQFTLHADTRRGRRPSFDKAADPDTAKRLYRSFADTLGELGFPPQEGIFGAHMCVRLENDGPVTILLDSQVLLERRRS